MAKRKRKARSASARKRRRRRPNPFAANPPRRRRTRRARPRARARRRRRNPPFGGGGGGALTPRGIVNRIVQGATDALVVVGGEAGANIITGYIPPLLTQPGAPAADGSPTKVETQAGLIVRKLLGAAGVSVAATMLFSRKRDLQRFAVAGALSSLVKSTLRPVVAKLPAPFSGALSAGGRLVAYPSMRAYPAARRLSSGMVAAYPQRLRAYPAAGRRAPPLGQAGINPQYAHNGWGGS